MRMVPSRPVSALREHGLALQSRRDPLRLYLGGKGAAPVGWLCPIRLPSLECGGASRAQGRHAGIGRIGDSDGERRGMVAVRRRCRLRLESAHPGTRPAGPLANGDLQAGRHLADHRDRHVQGSGTYGSREGTGRRSRDRRRKGRPARAYHGNNRRQGRRRRA